MAALGSPSHDDRNAQRTWELALPRELMMNLAFALDQLQKARRITTDGHSCILKQCKTIARLEREGRDTTEARLVLQSLEEMQARYETLRDQVETQVLALVKPTEDD